VRSRSQTLSLFVVVVVAAVVSIQTGLFDIVPVSPGGPAGDSSPPPQPNGHRRQCLVGEYSKLALDAFN